MTYFNMKLFLILRGEKTSSEGYMLNLGKKKYMTEITLINIISELVDLF